MSMRYKIGLWGFLLVILFFLFTEHRAHLLGVLLYLLVAACPLTHLLMHSGHRHDGKGK